ncbi:MAG TPA: hypothetical protein VLE96_05665 [Chlamydiales bacterium]|nr:hypothetical protein [Chlamydiales bacterium]
MIKEIFFYKASTDTPRLKTGRIFGHIWTWIRSLFQSSPTAAKVDNVASSVFANSFSNVLYRSRQDAQLIENQAEYQEFRKAANGNRTDYFPNFHQLMFLCQKNDFDPSEKNLKDILDKLPPEKTNHLHERIKAHFEISDWEIGEDKVIQANQKERRILLKDCLLAFGRQYQTYTKKNSTQNLSADTSPSDSPVSTEHAITGGPDASSRQNSSHTSPTPTKSLTDSDMEVSRSSSPDKASSQTTENAQSISTETQSCGFRYINGMLVRDRSLKAGEINSNGHVIRSSDAEYQRFKDVPRVDRPDLVRFMNFTRPSSSEKIL